MQYYKSFFCILVPLLLVACAHPARIAMNESYDNTIAELGRPDSEQQLADGSVRLVYSTQPNGQQSYVMIFNPQGNLIFRENQLQRKYFEQVKPREQDSNDIFQLFGKPCEKWIYKNLNEHTFMYRFEEYGQALAFWVDFDLKTDKVVRYEITIDPWTQKDSDFLDF